MSGSGGADRAAAQAREDEQARESKIAYGTKVLRGKFAQQFTDDYYKKLADTGTQMYTPQVNQQYEQSLKDLRAALYRSGNESSTVAQQMQDNLNEQRARAAQDITNNVQGIVNQRRQNVANAELQTVGQLQSSADAAASAAQANNLINIQSQPEAWSPLGQVFTDATAGLATQADLERAGQNRYNVGVSNWLKPSRRYVSNVGVST